MWCPQALAPPGGMSPGQNWRWLPLRNAGRMKGALCAAYCQDGAAADGVSNSRRSRSVRNAVNRWCIRTSNVARCSPRRSSSIIAANSSSRRLPSRAFNSRQFILQSLSIHPAPSQTRRACHKAQPRCVRQSFCCTAAHRPKPGAPGRCGAAALPSARTVPATRG